ncbi:MAG: GYD domain-containing protein [Acidiferrobacterales bacterium]
MATFISLLSFTDQGIRNIKRTIERAEVFTELAKKADITVKDIYWTLGHYDIVTVMEAPNDEAVVSLFLSAGSLGNVRTQTLRGFSAEQMKQLLEALP